jgi:GNAT superfamily N-acetyltransferase
VSAALVAPLVFRKATLDDVGMIVEIRSAAAHELGQRFGEGSWSRAASERGVSAGFRQSMVWLAFDRDEAVGTLRLSTRKPWAIDRTLFTPVNRPLYLTDMAVHPTHQRRGVGRALLAEAERVALAFPAHAIWLDAYDAPAGAAGFYAACGFREVGRRAYRDVPLVYFERRLR